MQPTVHKGENCHQPVGGMHQADLVRRIEPERAAQVCRNAPAAARRPADCPSRACRSRAIDFAACAGDDRSRRPGARVPTSGTQRAQDIERTRSAATAANGLPVRAASLSMRSLASRDRGARSVRRRSTCRPASSSMRNSNIGTGGRRIVRPDRARQPVDDRNALHVLRGVEGEEDQVIVERHDLADRVEMVVGRDRRRLRRRKIRPCRRRRRPPSSMANSHRAQARDAAIGEALIEAGPQADIGSRPRFAPAADCAGPTASAAFARPAARADGARHGLDPEAARELLRASDPSRPR